MKKSMIFVGLLAIGFANAQEYDGKVGINTNEPKATLDITPEASNLTGTTNEGIIAPRLTKTRIANIEASKLTEGTLVYATDAVYTAGADTAKNGRVAKINEKGYYFYNGTEWVKVQYKDTDTNDAEWVYDDSTKRINLKRSGQTTGFTAKVFFDSEKGRYINVDTTENVMREANIMGDDIVSDIIEEGSSFNVSHLKADKINYNYSNSDTYYAPKDESFLQVNNEATQKAGLHLNGHFSNLNTYTYTDANTTNNLGSLAGGYFRAVHRGTGKVQNAMTGSISAALIKAGSATAVYGTTSYTAAQNTERVGYLYASLSQNYIGKTGSTSSFNIGNAIGSVAVNDIRSGGKIDDVVGVLANNNFRQSKELTINNVYGFRYVPASPATTPATIRTHYGIFVENITGATSNYAVYTKAGKVRVGDLADTSATTDRTVVVDKDGVLKVGTATTADTTLKATDTTEQCTADKAGTIHYKEVAISGATNGEKKGVFGFCTKQNGNAVWVYLSNGGNIMQGTGTFGQGL